MTTNQSPAPAFVTVDVKAPQRTARHRTKGNPMKTTDICERFARDTAEHTLQILHDHGLYRHLRFTSPKSSYYWFDLITVPGALVFQGDGDSYVFRRVQDMFAFFRGSAYRGKPNPQYWAEKLTTGSVVTYDQDILAARVRHTAARAKVLTGLADAIRTEVLDELIGDETIDRQTVEGFGFYVNDTDRYAYPRKEPDFRFHDTWEWELRDYCWWYVWACHAIVWGIAQYDASKAPEVLTAQPCAPGGEAA